ncbi:efflux RND transporter periplasmic adaptor subunit [Tautonia sociabilis]|uniref:HlyD family efflux transporter periplasmic adaptor subunit n=1 Tax=Tautonia sociabilis TaxID=2080755 RepID=A0A432MPV3_9BACT|nr:efflux RND transporter periplasmic adaptor subunit [Tautonia sociabilis]RUL89494.1 HlyD family efflux transporter periplasmic adaptor subunit [Tautonia sociabilis]
MTISLKSPWLIGLAVAVGAALLFTGNGEHKTASREHGEEAEAFERGPHRGRMLRDGDFAVEITIFEDNTPPQFHLYAYEDDKPLDPKEVDARITLKRLDGEVNDFQFTPKGDYLDGGATVTEPHSFDVTVDASRKDEKHHWEFSSYEGRVTITPEAAKAAGIQTEKAGPGLISEILPLSGHIVPDPNRMAQLKARFPGVVREMRKNLGDAVEAGEVVALMESNETLQPYPVKSPIGGVIIARNGNIGDVAGELPLYEVADLSTVWVEFHVFPRNAAKVKPGQKVKITSMQDDATAEAVITAVPPVADTDSQSVLARAALDNADGIWRTGLTVRGEVTLAEKEAPLTVKTSALQRFRDFTVVFAQVGDAYEVRMLQLGLQDAERAEVLEGLKPGSDYVTENSFLIKADIDKSGASHDH